MYKIIVSLILGIILYVSWWHFASTIDDLEAKNKDLVIALTAANQQIISLQESVSNIRAQAKKENEIHNRIKSLDSSLKRLQSAIENSTAVASKTPEACNRALIATGELFGECGKRYLDMAGKAELLKSGIGTLNKHIDILEAEREKK